MNNPVLVFKDGLHNGIRWVRRPRFILLTVPLYLMSMLINGVARAQNITAPLQWVRDYALIFYNSVFGTLNDLHIFEVLAIGSLGYVAIYYFSATARKTPLRLKKMTWQATFKATAGYLFDMMFIICVFLSASLNLLNALATAPESVSMGVQIYGVGMTVFTLFYARIKQKLHLLVEDPTNLPFDPLLLLLKMWNYLTAKKEPILVPCLVARATL